MSAQSKILNLLANFLILRNKGHFFKTRVLEWPKTILTQKEEKGKSPTCAGPCPSFLHLQPYIFLKLYKNLIFSKMSVLNPPKTHFFFEKTYKKKRRNCFEKNATKPLRNELRT